MAKAQISQSVMEVVKFQHRQLMVKVGQRLGSKDLDELKYLCGDIVASSALDCVKSPTDLFTLLQYHGHLSPGCYEFTKRSLSSIGRDDLASMLPDPTNDALTKSQPVSLCQLKHRMMLVSIADQLRREDTVKMAFVGKGIVETPDQNEPSNAVMGLGVFANLEDSGFLRPGCYSFLCDLLRLIGRCDLADFICGFPARNLPLGFTMQGQTLGLMVEILGRKKISYTLHQKKLCTMKEGSSDLIQYMHSVILDICIEGLTSGNVTSGTKLLQECSESQLQFLQCIFDTEELKFKDRFNFINDAYGFDDDGIEEYPCPVAESAHQVRKFIFEASCEVIGTAKVTKIKQLNSEIERGINICSGYAKHVLSLLSCLTSLLITVNQKQIGEVITEVVTANKCYLLAAFPLLVPYFKTESLESLSTSLGLSQQHCGKESQFNGIVAMVVIPSYTLLLSLWLLTNGYTIDIAELKTKLLEYIRHCDHITGSREFIQKCAATLHNDVSSFTQQIIELDDLCAPLIKELVNY